MPSQLAAYARPDPPTRARSCALSLFATASSFSSAAILTSALLVALPAQLPGPPAWPPSLLAHATEPARDAAAPIWEADSPSALYPDTTLLATCSRRATQERVSGKTCMLYELWKSCKRCHCWHAVGSNARAVMHKANSVNAGCIDARMTTSRLHHKQPQPTKPQHTQ